MKGKIFDLGEAPFIIIFLALCLLGFILIFQLGWHFGHIEGMELGERFGYIECYQDRLYGSNEYENKSCINREPDITITLYDKNKTEKNSSLKYTIYTKIK